MTEVLLVLLMAVLASSAGIAAYAHARANRGKDTYGSGTHVDKDAVADRSKRVAWSAQRAIQPSFGSSFRDASPDDPDVLERAYRAPPGGTSGTHRWDPYNAANSRESRVRAARRKARSSRPFIPGAQAARPKGGRDHYAVLGVSVTATSAEIERAYRRLVAGEHPDRYFNDPAAMASAEARLREANEAARVLRDPERRARYDELRSG